jgi:DNA repair exonuclease SbcCD ATPase subunit
MSLAKSFGSVDKTIEERVKDLERQVSVYQDKLSSSDQIAEQFQSLLIRFEQVKELVLTQKASLDAMGESVASLNNAMAEKLNKAITDQSQLSSDIQRHKEQIALNNQGIESNFKALKNSVDISLQGLARELNLKSDQSALQEFREAIAKVKDSVLAQIDSHVSLTNDNLSSFKRLIQEIDSNGVNISNYADDHSSIMEKIADLKKNISSYGDQLAQASTQLSSQISNSISNLRGELTSKPSDIMQFKDEVSKRLDLIAMDGSNANARSLNSDQKISFLEKKLESLLLQIKKLELSK